MAEPDGDRNGWPHRPPVDEDVARALLRDGDARFLALGEEDEEVIELGELGVSADANVHGARDCKRLQARVILTRADGEESRRRRSFASLGMTGSIGRTHAVRCHPCRFEY